MKDFPEDDSSYTPYKSANLSLPTRFAAWLTGSSVDELAFAPDAERRAVRLAGLSLTLISVASMLGWWVAMGIARAEYTPWNLPYAVLSGVLVYTVDRAMLRVHWHRAGLRAAKARGFHTPEHLGWLAPLMHGLLRIAVSVIVSLTTASFIELEIFRHDTDAYLATQNREQNQPVFQAAAGRVDAEINIMMRQIADFDDQANAIVGESIRAQNAAQAAAEAQVQALTSERTALQDRIVTLSKEVDCQTSNGAAEETGGVRCDGTEATAGTGMRYRVAGELADYARTERASAEARLQAIDADLTRLQTPLAGPLIAPETQAQLNQIATLRAGIAEVLNQLTQDRDQAIHDSAMEDAAFVPMPEGLIVRGEALDALTGKSPWLFSRIILVMLSLTVLDLAAIFVITVQPAPKGLVLGEVLASEIVMHQALARAEQAIGHAKQTAFGAREMTMKAEDEVDQRITSLRQAMKTRKMVNDRIDGDLEARLN